MTKKMTSKIQDCQQQTLCRMSWFLIRQENSQQFSIIHSVDLVEDSTDAYINRRVKYRRDQSILYGMILSASDDRNFIEQQLRQLLNEPSAVEQQPINIQLPPKRWFLVQYSKSANNIVHTVINQSDVVWVLNNNEREIFINDGIEKRLSTVLHVSDDENKISEEIKTLKSKCFNLIFTDPIVNGNEKPWMLVQYSSGVNTIVYAVIHESETVWKTENVYKDVIAYLSNGPTIYQAIILKRSNERHDVDLILKNIKEISLSTKYPLEKDKIATIDYSLGSCRVDSTMDHIDVEYVRFNRPTQTEKNTDEDESGEENTDSEYSHEADVLQRLDFMDCRMQHENHVINFSFNSLDCVRNAMNHKLLILDYLLAMVDVDI